MRTTIIIAVLVGMITTGNAQTQKNYWVVESNKTVSIVRIYDNGHNLLNETKVDRVIDTRNRKQQRLLNRLAKGTITTAVAVNGKR